MGYLDNAGLSRFYEGIKSRYFLKANVANDLTTTEAGKALDARQGKALDASVKAAIARAEQSSSPYAHSRTGTVHELTGTGKLGHTVMTADYEDGDTFAVNGEAVTVVGEADELVEGSAMIFSLEEDGLYIYAISNPFAVPDGATALPVDDVKTWIECTGLRYAQVGSPSLTAVLADESLLGTLFASINAMEYFKRSLGLQTEMYQSVVAKAALDASAPFISAEMTSATSPEGYSVTTSAFGGGNGQPWNCTTADKIYQPFNVHAGRWVALSLPQAVWPYRITLNNQGINMTADGNAFGSFPTLGFYIQASKDGKTWVDLVEVLNTHTEKVYYPNPQSQKYQHYRILLTTTTHRANLSNFRIYGK